MAKANFSTACDWKILLFSLGEDRDIALEANTDNTEDRDNFELNR